MLLSKPYSISRVSKGMSMEFCSTGKYIRVKNCDTLHIFFLISSTVEPPSPSKDKFQYIFDYKGQYKNDWSRCCFHIGIKHTYIQSFMFKALVFKHPPPPIK